MIQMPAALKQFRSDRTSGLVTEDKWITPSMMHLSAMGQSKVSNRKRWRRIMDICAYNTLYASKIR